MSEDEGARYTKEEMSEAISKRVNEVTASLKAETQAQIKTAVDAVRKDLTPKAEPEKEYTRQELNDLVKKREMSEADAQTIFDSQNALKTRQTAESAALRAVENKEYTDRTQGSINKYMAFDSDLGVPGSDSYTRIQNEVRNQCNILGVNEPTLGVELAALRQVYGDESGLTSNEPHRTTHQETPGAGISSTETQGGMPKGLSGREKSFYEDGIRNGRYKDWDAVKEELSYANDGIRSRAAAR